MADKNIQPRMLVQGAYPQAPLEDSISLPVETSAGVEGISTVCAHFEAHEPCIKTAVVYVR